ncbi:MAG TPA: hypothetical protein VFR49_07535, partial [Solirubrobacteraceae bacterium]|nr:hypothetical protein [Solirubrobacteraceae bacterium]
GLLYAAVAVGATAAALTTGWLERARRLGRIVLVAVIVWGGAIAGAGLVGTLWAAAGLLAVAGAVASLTSARTSVLSGGLACIVGAALVVLAFPALVAYDGGERPQHGAVAAVEAEGV